MVIIKLGLNRGEAMVFLEAEDVRLKDNIIIYIIMIGGYSFPCNLTPMSTQLTASGPLNSSVESYEKGTAFLILTMTIHLNMKIIHVR